MISIKIVSERMKVGVKCDDLPAIGLWKWLVCFA